MILFDKTYSLIKRYSEIIRRIHAVWSQLDTSSNQRDFNKYLYYMSRVWFFNYNAILPFSPQKSHLNYVPNNSIYRSKRRIYGLPTIQLPDGLTSLRPLSHLRPATRKLRPATWGPKTTCDPTIKLWGWSRNWSFWVVNFLALEEVSPSLVICCYGSDKRAFLFYSMHTF